MKKLVQIVTLFTAVTLAASLFAGCDTKSGDISATVSTSEQTAVGEDPYKEPVDLTVALWSIGEALVDGPDEVRDAIYKKFNVTLKPDNITWSDYKNKVMIWAASSQLPDLFAYDAIGTATYKDWVTQGIIKALPDDLSKYPNVKSIISDENAKVYKFPVGDVNGKYYAIPRMNHKLADEWSCDNGIQIRKDWMTNVGVTKDPETMDEFTDLMLKFVNNDPDQNGKKDTIGLTCYDASYFRYILMAYEPNFDGWARDVENPGQWIPGWMAKNFLKGLKAMNKLFYAGGLDKDFGILKGEEGEDKFASGKAGAYSHDVTPATLEYLAGKYEKINPGKKYEDVIKILHPLKNENGKFIRQISAPFWSETYFNAKCDDIKVARGIALIDYFMSEEGYNLIHYGIEGKDYTKDSSGVVSLTPEKDAEGLEIPLGNLYPFTKVSFFAEWGGTRQWTRPSTKPVLQQMSKANHDWLMANAVPMDTDLNIGYLDIPSREKSSVLLKDIVIKCILSKDVEKTWTEEANAAKANGFIDVIRDTNNAAKAAGIK